MSGMSGADVVGLRSLARQFENAATRLDSGRGEVRNAIAIKAWFGPAAVQFRYEWESDHSRRLHLVAGSLRDAARSLRSNADDQERTSTADAAAPRTPSSLPHERGLGPAPSSTRGYLDTLHSMKNKDEAGGDGVRVQEVLGDDGVVRLVVYLNGTNSASGGLFSLDDNLGLALGGSSDTLDYVRTMITNATRDRPDMEVMLVGFSQGGMVAQRIASEREFNVRTIVTIGSASYNTPNACGGADILRLEHLGDPVPVTDAEVGVGGWLDARSREESFRAAGAVDTTFQNGNPFQTFVPQDDEAFPHFDQADYRWLADEFDRSTGPDHVALRESMARFQGAILSDRK